MVGAVISHYRILEKLGAGGMGEVYLAEDTSLGRRVALKILPDEHTQDPERLARFKQEAKAASALNHPNILTIHEVGVADGHHFIATEFVEGQTLAPCSASRGRLQTGEALDVAAQVASALAAAHGAGIVHRDIKPENIMLRNDGYVKVLDFGLAKLTESAVSGSAETAGLTESFQARTEAGTVLGTAQYMSPEQASGRKVDARSDIFSLGSVLYEMVSGQRAFQRGTVMETVAAIINREPEPLPDRTPPEVSKLILALPSQRARAPIPDDGGSEGRAGRSARGILRSSPTPPARDGSDSGRPGDRSRGHRGSSQSAARRSPSRRR